MNIGPILSTMIQQVIDTGEAVSKFDLRTGDPWVYKIRCRDMQDALDDLRLEILREHNGVLVSGRMVVIADDEGFLRMSDGPWKAAYRGGPSCN